MGDFWQTTSQLYSSLFEKPKMLEKLLIKPPFKYIFDIITETAKSTGFGNGLYSQEELNPENYNQKETKLIYLKKMIDLVQLMNKQELAVKPNKVVAGLEPENTNIFLQEIYKLAVSGTDSNPFVKKVLAKYAKMAEEDQEEKKEDKKQITQKPPEEKKEEPPKKPPQKQPEEPPKKPKVEAAPIKKKDSLTEEPQKKKEEPPKKEEPMKKENDPAKKATAKQPIQKETSKEMTQETTSTTTANVRPGSASKKAGKIKTNVVTQEKNSAKGEGTSGVIMDKKSFHNEEEDMGINENENPTNYKAGSNFEGKGKFTKETLKEEKENLESETTIKKKDEDTGNTIKMGKIGLNKKKDDPSKNYYDAGTAGGAGKFDVEAIKKLVQSLCQNTNPLGKSLEFLNDDIDSMNKENDYWKKQYLASKQKYLAELKKSDEELQPLSDKLGELDEQIRDQKARIQSMRGQIIRNTATIQNLLYSVVTNK